VKSKKREETFAMPLYEYHCDGCDANIELLIRNSEEKPECPHCGGKKLVRLLSVVSGHVAGGSSSGSRESAPMPDAGGCGKPWCGTGACGRMQ
jgi:putative FmdB family regulatory protein